MASEQMDESGKETTERKTRRSDDSVLPHLLIQSGRHRDGPPSTPPDVSRPARGTFAGRQPRISFGPLAAHLLMPAHGPPPGVLTGAPRRGPAETIKNNILDYKTLTVYKTRLWRRWTGAAPGGTVSGRSAGAPRSSNGNRHWAQANVPEGRRADRGRGRRPGGRLFRAALAAAGPDDAVAGSGGHY
jgi:hypothetical protein